MRDLRVKFGVLQVAWMEALAIKGSMSVLINESATKDFVVGKWMKQGDPLSPFLFIVIMEGLTRLMENAVDSNLFNKFKVNEDVSYNIVQFADDILFIGDRNWDNLWCIKSLLRVFEVVSGLCVKFYKSGIGGLNLKPKFLEAGSFFFIVVSVIFHSNFWVF